MVPDIAVLGSINMDLTVKVEDFPSPGETVRGSDLQQLPGGKGANQAVAAAKLGGDVSMFGLLGEDNFGTRLENSLNAAGVGTEYLGKREVSSGIALIAVDRGAENEIIIVPGANGAVDRAYVEETFEEIRGSSVLLLQLEIPLETVEYVLARLADFGEEGPTVILDPAPATQLSDKILENVDILTPNKVELQTIAPGISKEDLLESAQIPEELVPLFERDGALLLKEGESGSTYIGSSDSFSSPPFPVDSEDSTAAGDAFNGALAASLAEGGSMREAVKFANAAGALSTKRAGAQPSLPERDQVKEFIGSIEEGMG